MPFFFTDDSFISEGTSHLDPKIVDEILDIEQGFRPDPSTYLSPEYIDNHLAQFDGGVTRIEYKAPDRDIGPPAGTFAMPKSVADDLIEQAGGDVRKLEELLGLKIGYLGDAPVRVDIPEPMGLRMPSGNEPGANEFWVPGGYTSGGIIEAVIDQVPLDKVNVKSIFN